MLSDNDYIGSITKKEMLEAFTEAKSKADSIGMATVAEAYGKLIELVSGDGLSYLTEDDVYNYMDLCDSITEGKALGDIVGGDDGSVFDYADSAVEDLSEYIDKLPSEVEPDEEEEETDDDMAQSEEENNVGTEENDESMEEEFKGATISKKKLKEEAPMMSNEDQEKYNYHMTEDPWQYDDPAEDDEDKAYNIVGYYDNKFRGRAEDFDTDDKDEAIDTVAYYLTKGYYVMVNGNVRFTPDEVAEDDTEFEFVADRLNNIGESLHESVKRWVVYCDEYGERGTARRMVESYDNKKKALRVAETLGSDYNFEYGVCSRNEWKNK